MSTIEIVGIAGAVPVLTAYALASTRPERIPPKALALLNLGAGALALNAAAHHAWPSMLLNAIWFLVAAVALGRPAARRPAASNVSTTKGPRRSWRGAELPAFEGPHGADWPIGRSTTLESRP